jgi:hypothetical protein
VSAEIAAKSLRKSADSDQRYWRDDIVLVLQVLLVAGDMIAVGLSERI